MCVWTKKRGSMKAEVLVATPCPKSLHGKGERRWVLLKIPRGEKWIARNILKTDVLKINFSRAFAHCGK